MARVLGLLTISASYHALRRSHCNADEQRYYQASRYDPAVRTDTIPNTKIVHFVRHAEGHHNVAGRNDPLLGYLREDLEDATLTDEGVSQCKALNSQTRNRMDSAQLLVVSPLNRTMQTASIAFPQLKGKIPWIALENLREQTGLHPCDRRRSISEHKEQYQHIDFSNVADDKDPLYWKYRLREPKSDVAIRALRLMDWLKERPEKEIIVVTHHGYLLQLLGEVVHTGNPGADAVDFKNCEMRTFIVQF